MHQFAIKIKASQILIALFYLIHQYAFIRTQMNAICRKNCD